MRVRRDEREECTRHCGSVATCVVTRLSDGRSRPYCTECTVEAIDIFGEAIKVDVIAPAPTA